MNKTLRFVCLLAIVVVASGCISLQRTPQKVSVADEKLFVNGKLFEVKGVTYSPIPIGNDPKKPRPSDVEWIEHPEIYKHDFALMKMAGINTIRVLNLNASVSSTRAMLDTAEQYNIKVIMGYEGPLKADLADRRVRNQIRMQVATMVRNYKDHPAILMWMIGNEVNYWYPKEGNVGDWYTLLEEITRQLKQIDPNHPVMTANNALSQMDLFTTLSPSVDIYGTNAYSLTQGPWDWLYDQFGSYKTGKPIIVTETGADSWNSNAGKDDEGMQAAMVQNIVQENTDKPHGIGIVLFEWVDEWWKSDRPYTQDGTNDWQPYDLVNASDSYYSEEYFGIVRQEPDTHIRFPKYAYYVVQQLWGKDPVDSPPTVQGVTLIEREGKTFIVADIVTYGNVSANVSVRYKNVGNDWDSGQMTREGDYFVAPVALEGSIPLVDYELTATDAFGQKKAINGRILKK